MCLSTYGQSDGVFGKSDLLETELIQIDTFEIKIFWRDLFTNRSFGKINNTSAKFWSQLWVTFTIGSDLISILKQLCMDRCHHPTTMISFCFSKTTLRWFLYHLPHDWWFWMTREKHLIMVPVNHTTLALCVLYNIVSFVLFISKEK